MSSYSEISVLFNNLHASLERIKYEARSKLLSSIEGSSLEFLKTLDQTKLVGSMLTQFPLSVPKIDLNSVEISQEEVRINTNSSLSIGTGTGRNPIVMGTRIIYTIPYTGSRDLFFCKPSMNGMSVYPRGIVGAKNLQLCFDYQNLSNANVEGESGTAIGQVNQYLAWLEPEVEQVKTDMKQIANEKITAKLARDAEASEVIESLRKPKS